jgi:hypothetical protein
MQPSKSRNRVLNFAAWLVLAGLIALFVGTIPAPAASAETCRDSGSEPKLKTQLGLFFVHDKKFELPFGESRKPQTRAITIEAYTEQVTPKNLLAAIDEGLVSSLVYISEDGKGLTAGAQVLTVGNIASGVPAKIRVCVKLDPAQIVGLRPGRYTGTVRVRAEAYQEAAIPIVATFRSSRRDGLEMAVAGVFVGLLVKMLTELGSGRRSGNPGGLHALWNYMKQWSFPLTIILGVVTGWLGFIEIYDANPTWGADGTDALKLFGTCFGFQMGSIGGADMAKRLVG